MERATDITGMTGPTGITGMTGPTGITEPMDYMENEIDLSFSFFDIYPLHDAAEHGEIDRLKVLLDTNDVNLRDGIGNSLLHTIVASRFRASDQAKYQAIATLLLVRGANINLQNRFDETPLHLAVLNEDPSMISFLLDHGVNVNVESGAMTPLRLASSLLRRSDITKIIKDHMVKSGIVCPICLHSPAECADVEHRATPCCHQFICQHCIDEQRARNHKCPLCVSTAGW